MLASVPAIARNTFIEAIRQPVYFVVVGLGSGLQVLNTWLTGFSMGYKRVPGEVTGDDKFLLDIGLSTVFVCGMLLAAFIATAAISREIENKTILTVVSKPVARAGVILGKYIGLSGAMILAIHIMVIALLLALRHGVLSTAADDPDQPVILFSLIAVGGALLIAGITNYMYGWQFVQTAVLTLAGAITVAWVATLFVNEKWEVQPLATDLKPQIMLACFAMGMALLVLTAIATAASTRLGQVMTIVVCVGVFVLGLLSNHLVGRHVFDNAQIGRIDASLAGDVTDRSFTSTGSTYTIKLARDPTVELSVGDTIYWGPAPNGVALLTPPYDGFDPDAIDLRDTKFIPGTPAGIVITEVDGTTLHLKNIGNPPAAVARPPMPLDYIFIRPTETNAPALAAWAVIPNMHSFWMVDAVTLARPVPPSHFVLIALYALTLIAAALSIAVILFEGRDVG